MANGRRVPSKKYIGTQGALIKWFLWGRSYRIQWAVGSRQSVALVNTSALTMTQLAAALW
jgi:hypothetical protein